MLLSFSLGNWVLHRALGCCLYACKEEGCSKNSIFNLCLGSGSLPDLAEVTTLMKTQLEEIYH